jgi:hypothetical protein
VNFSHKKAQKAQKISGPYLSFLCLFVAKIAFASLVHAQSTDLPKWVKDAGARRAPKAKRTCLVDAAGDGVANSTKTIQQAIDKCAKSGGGIVTFKPGNYVSGALFLKSNVHLRVDTGVTLTGSQDDADYPSLWTRVAGI